MRIVMIGHSNAGKTTYISSMYGLGRAGISGFRLRSKDAAQEAELIRHAGEIQRGTYPPPSAHRVEYGFVLSHHRRDFFDFTWSDYRGGALLDRATDKETESVLEDLRKADGIVVFADAQALLTDDAAPRQMRRLTVLLQRALAERTRAVPLVLAYTKADLVPEDPGAWVRIKQPLAPITAAANAEGDIVATEVAVSCGVAPRNVQVPLLWCLSHIVTAKVRHLESEVSTSRRMQRDARAKAGVVDDISSWWNGTDSYNKQAEQAKKWAKEELAELRPLQRPARKLARTLVRMHSPAGEVVRAERSAATAADRERRADFRSSKSSTGKSVAKGVLLILLAVIAWVVIMSLVFASM